MRKRCDRASWVLFLQNFLTCPNLSHPQHFLVRVAWIILGLPSSTASKLTSAERDSYCFSPLFSKTPACGWRPSLSRIGMISLFGETSAPPFLLLAAGMRSFMAQLLPSFPERATTIVSPKRASSSRVARCKVAACRSVFSRIATDGATGSTLRFLNTLERLFANAIEKKSILRSRTKFIQKGRNLNGCTISAVDSQMNPIKDSTVK